jgi:hypothetical protein
MNLSEALASLSIRGIRRPGRPIPRLIAHRSLNNALIAHDCGNAVILLVIRLRHQRGIGTFIVSQVRMLYWTRGRWRRVRCNSMTG